MKLISMMRLKYIYTYKKLYSLNYYKKKREEKKIIKIYTYKIKLII